MLTREIVLEKIRPVADPEICISVVDLGLIYDVEIVEQKIVNITMTLTTPGCPYGPALLTDIEDAVKELEGVEKVTITLVWDPPWNPEEMASEKAKDELGIW